jgi:hypothetical protein
MVCSCGLNSNQEPSIAVRGDGFFRCNDCQRTHEQLEALEALKAHGGALKELQRRAAPASGGFIDQGASRSNAGKPPLHLIPYDAVAMVAWVLHFGACKYAARGWEQGKLSWTDCVRAIIAHTSKLLCGQWLDDESGCPHVAHIGCNALFLCAMSARGIGVADLTLQAPPSAPGALGFNVWSQTDAQRKACEAVLEAKAKAPRVPTV